MSRPNSCATCRFWRVKSDVYGICDNPQMDGVMVRTTPSDAVLIRHGGTNADFLRDSGGIQIRTREDFRCLLFERRPANKKGKTDEL
jgi:hypothetical protein